MKGLFFAGTHKSPPPEKPAKYRMCASPCSKDTKTAADSFFLLRTACSSGTFMSLRAEICFKNLVKMNIKISCHRLWTADGFQHTGRLKAPCGSRAQLPSSPFHPNGAHPHETGRLSHFRTC